ncbi:hypothetical protein CEUSTIGMA_g4944.t1 [Chlamydomonas eustigma]|uniref:CAAX prenyl protease 2/Lysostaphin resistance protein A-like domain-containing protein n=1 Tax=Chlamydomonas eustigma TaxID=1157962 RepID=A0A250X410_9CHLO|nr:hypothetical protein CEUSTIGMA_g4944.t1 [Chlamydomonas eustigma]|eukprot:GAX77500.1 hypothetical protein CEUSTIGMA_g4944.t1 [Chlamydomonas eustigma]
MMRTQHFGLATKRGNRVHGRTLTFLNYVKPQIANLRTTLHAMHEGLTSREDHGVPLPWSQAQFIISFSQILCLQLPLAYGGVDIWCKLRGIPSVTELPANEIGLAALSSDVLQFVGVLYIITTQLLGNSAPTTTETIATAISATFVARPASKDLSSMQSHAVLSSMQSHAVLSSMQSHAVLKSGASEHTTDTEKDSKVMSQGSCNSELSFSNWSMLSYSLTLGSVGLGLFGAACAVVSIVAIELTMGFFAPSENVQPTNLVVQLLSESSTVGATFFILSNVIVGPVTEELVYRGILMPSLSCWMSPRAALVASSLLFAIYHLSWSSLIPLTCLGMCLGGSLLLSRGNLAAPTLAHIVYNAWALAFSFFQEHEPGLVMTHE